MIVLRVNTELCKYFLVECSSLKDKHHQMSGRIIRTNHDEYGNLGVPENSFINYSNTCWLLEKYLKPPPGCGENPMGICNFIDEVEDGINKLKPNL